jgi:hypothetical protein
MDEPECSTRFRNTIGRSFTFVKKRVAGRLPAAVVRAGFPLRHQ